MPPDPFDACDRCEEAVKSLLEAEVLLAEVQVVRSEDDEIGECDHIRVCCASASEYQKDSGLWVVKAEVKLSVHGLDDGARERLLTYWKVIHQTLRRRDLPEALTSATLRVHGARAWEAGRSREESSWLRTIGCELLANLRA